MQLEENAWSQGKITFRIIAKSSAHTVSAPEGILAQTDSSEEDLNLFANC